MTNPYFLMIILYIGLAILTALDAALISFDILLFLRGLRWLRIHFITLGILTELIFALMPNLVAIRTKQPKPKLRWDIWATLNAGILTLLVGIPMIDTNVILIGGTLVFTATTLLSVQLYQMRGKGTASANSADEIDPHIGRKFYFSFAKIMSIGNLVG